MVIAADNNPRVYKLRGLKGLWLSPPAPVVPPTELGGLYGWWKADTLTNLVQGSEVVHWIDSSGNGFHMTPNSVGGTIAPYYTNGYQNGLPALYFDGLNDKLTNACDAPYGTNTIFVVVKHMIPDGVQSTLFNAKRQLTDEPLVSFQFIHTDYSSNRLEEGLSSIYGKNPGTNITTTYTVQIANTNSAIWTNGVLAASGTIGFGGFFYDGMVVGATRDSDMWFRGYVMEMFILTNTYATTGTILSDGNNYLRAKWANY